MLFQPQYTVIRPYISSTALSVSTTNGSPAMTSAALFGSVAAGMPVKGPNIPRGTYVLSKTDASNLVLTKNATATGTANHQFGYNGAPGALASGDVMGFQFPVNIPGGQSARLKSIRAIFKSSAFNGATNLWLYNTDLFTESDDNAAHAPVDAEYLSNVIAVVPIQNSSSYMIVFGGGAGGAFYTPVAKLDILVPGGTVYGLMVSNGAITPATDRDLYLYLEWGSI